MSISSDITIRRRPAPDKPVQIDRNQLLNQNLSYAATGLYAILCSLPDDWVIRRNDLINKKTNGRQSVQSAINELKEHGYIKTVTHRNTKGQVTHKLYEFSEIPNTKNVTPCKTNTSLHKSINRFMDDVPPPPTTEKPDPTSLSIAQNPSPNFTLQWEQYSPNSDFNYPYRYKRLPVHLKTPNHNQKT